MGKSSAIRHLGETFTYFIEVNFEKRTDIASVFGSIHDVREVAAKIGILYDKPVVPGKTLLFLDEIQACPEAIKSLWFFKDGCQRTAIRGSD